MLILKELNVYYGAIHALKNISLEVNKGEIVTLIGANGAGKSSTLKAISRLITIKSGDIIYEGNSIKTVPAHKLVQMGIVQVPEGRKIFSNLTVKENLELGAYYRKDKKGISNDYESVYSKFPRLMERKLQIAGTLSGGEQQMLAIGRALMSKPKILLLDEPSMGLSPIIVQNIFNIIEEINESGTTILLVEQNAHMALKVANRAYVIANGTIVLKGKAEALLKEESVKNAYLGG
jgi:branched-chain amino acid transport system ATP-binding protein